MIQAVQAGEMGDSASAYHAEYEPGMPDPVYEAPASFSGYMENLAETAPAVVTAAPVEVSTEPAVAPSYESAHVSAGSAPAQVDVPVEPPAGEQYATPVVSSEQNDVPTVANQSPINSALQERARLYSAAKDLGATPAQAYQQVRRVAPPAPAPAPVQREQNAGEGAASVSMRCPNVRPPDNPPPAPVRTVAQSPTPPSVPASPPRTRSWAPRNDPAPVVQNAPPQQSGSPLQRERAQEPLVYQAGDQSNVAPSGGNQVTQAELDALSDEIFGGPDEDPFEAPPIGNLFD